MNKTLLHVEMTDGIFGKIVNMTDQRKAVMKYEDSGQIKETTVDMEDVKAVWSEKEWNRRRLKKKGLIIP